MSKIRSSIWFVQILNAGVGLVACGVSADVGEGIERAREVQRSGAALRTLDSWVELSQVRPNSFFGPIGLFWNSLHHLSVGLT
jgi:hypothetical protein